MKYEMMVRAMMERDRRYDGRFYVGVHSTGIYCLPSCRARKPLLKNVSFYSTREEALAAGLRSCKRCRAAQFPDSLPEWLYRVVKHMRSNRQQRLDERELSGLAGVDISTIRRYFKEHLQTTPLAFHRRTRLNCARDLIEQGSDYLVAAYECGWESASGFRSAFSKEFGKPPGAYYGLRQDCFS